MTELRPDAERLAAIFHAASPDPHGVGDLGNRLAAMLAAARQEHPRIPLDPAVFVRHLARHRPGDLPLDEWLGAVRAGDLFLACASAEGVPTAIAALDEQYREQVGSFLGSLRPTAAFIEDVAQAVRERVLVGAEGSPPRIVEYGGRGALLAWMRVVTVRLALDLRRKKTEAPDEDAGEGGDGPAAAPSAEGLVLKRRYAGDFNAAFREAFAALTDDQRLLLRRHFVEGATLEELAASAGVHRATVARRLAAARQAILADARRRLGARLALSPEDLSSLMGVMRSQLDLGLSSLAPEG
jgi:RNA polymerase sigma-70 factor (ECF subfamily)